MGERFITPASLPTAREREILNIIIEECAEVQHRACKALRFGLGEVQPGQQLSNSVRLAEEVGDLGAILALAEREGLIDQQRINTAAERKNEKLAIFMQTEKVDG